MLESQMSSNRLDFCPMVSFLKRSLAFSLVMLSSIGLIGVAGPSHAFTPSCTLLPARSATESGEVFLGGDFIELGLSARGSWGTSGDAPSGFRATSNSKLGMGADLDGYCATPSDNTDLPVDFFLPGGPEERWGVGFTMAGQEHYGSYSVLASDASSTGVTAVHTVTDETSGDNLSAKVVSVISLAGSEVLRVTATHSFQKSQAYFRTSVVFDNLSGSALTDVRFHRSFDPDNAVFQGGQYDTRQTILDTVSDGGTSVVQAKLIDSDLTALAANGKILDDLLNTSGITTEIPILFYSAEPQSVAYFGGFENPDPYKPAAFWGDSTDFFDSPQAKDSTVEADRGMGIIVRTLSLAAGATSESLDFVTSLDARDFDEIGAELSQVAGGGQSEGSSDSSSSPPAPLLPRIDSIFPTRVVAGDSVSIIGKRWTCTDTATFDSSTSPVAHGWLTPQLEQINFQVPSDQPLGSLQFTLDSCLGSFELNGLVTVVPAPFAITHLMYESEDLYEAMTDVKAVSALHRGDYMKVHCIVNSQKAEEEKINIGYELCSTALGQMPQGSRMVVTLKENYLLENTWTRVWFGN